MKTDNNENSCFFKLLYFKKDTDYDEYASDCHDSDENNIDIIPANVQRKICEKKYIEKLYSLLSIELPLLFIPS